MCQAGEVNDVTYNCIDSEFKYIYRQSLSDILKILRAYNSVKFLFSVNTDLPHYILGVCFDLCLVKYK